MSSTGTLNLSHAISRTLACLQLRDPVTSHEEEHGEHQQRLTKQFHSQRFAIQVVTAFPDDPEQHMLDFCDNL